MQEVMIFKPSQKYFKSRILVFVLHLLLFTLFYWATYKLRLGNFLWFNSLIFMYFLRFTLYLINYSKTKIMISDNNLSYQSLFKNRTLKINEIKSFEFKTFKILGSDQYDFTHYGTGSVALNYIFKHLDRIQIKSKNKKLNCFQSQELFRWLTNNIK